MSGNERSLATVGKERASRRTRNLVTNPPFRGPDFMFQPGVFDSALSGGRVTNGISASPNNPSELATRRMVERQEVSGSETLSIAGTQASPWGCNADGVTRPATCLLVSPDGRECIVGSADHAAYLFSSSDGSAVRCLYTRTSGHSDWVSSAAYVGGRQGIVTGGADGQLILWKRGSREAYRTINSGQGPVTVLKPLSQVVPLLLSAGFNGTLCVWDVSATTGRSTDASRVRKTLEHRGKMALPSITAVGVTQDKQDTCNKVMSGCSNGIVSLWDLDTGKCVRPVVGKHGTHVSHMEVAESTQDVYFSAAGDGRVAIWDTRTPLGSQSQDHIGATCSVTPFTCDDKKGGAPVTGFCAVNSRSLVASGADGRVCLWDIRRLDVLEMTYMKDDRSSAARGSVQGGHSNSPIGSLCVHPSKKMCFSGGMYDDWIVCHDLQTMKPLYGLVGNTQTATFMAVTTDRLIVSGDSGCCSIFVLS